MGTSSTTATAPWFGRQSLLLALAAVAALVMHAWFTASPDSSRARAAQPVRIKVPVRAAQLERCENDLRDARANSTSYAPPTGSMSMVDALNTPSTRVAWGERRRFDRKVAVEEGVWTKGNGGLHDADREILADLFFASDSVFETGVGESTTIATFTRVPRYTGVDGAVEWLNNVMKNAPPHWRFHWADIGRIAGLSKPTDKGTRPKWPEASFAALAAEREAFDFYNIDGRFRVASFAACMLHAMLRGKHDALFAIHVRCVLRRDPPIAADPLAPRITPNAHTFTKAPWRLASTCAEPRRGGRAREKPPSSASSSSSRV